MNFVKKIIFPLEILPIQVILSASFNFLINIILLLVTYLIIFKTVNYTIIFMPFIFIPFIILAIGVSLILSALGVYIRDILQITNILPTLLLFLSPIFIPETLLPDWAKNLLMFNPLSLIVTEFRNILLWQMLPNWLALLNYTLVSLFILLIGGFLFHRLRKGFADVL